MLDVLKLFHEMCGQSGQEGNHAKVSLLRRGLSQSYMVHSHSHCAHCAHFNNSSAQFLSKSSIFQFMYERCQLLHHQHHLHNLNKLPQASSFSYYAAPAMQAGLNNF